MEDGLEGDTKPSPVAFCRLLSPPVSFVPCPLSPKQERSLPYGKENSFG